MNKRPIMRHEADQNIKPKKVETLWACFVRHPIEFINDHKRAGVAYQRTN
jgi:hypothetical protein